MNGLELPIDRTNALTGSQGKHIRSVWFVYICHLFPKTPLPRIGYKCSPDAGCSRQKPGNPHRGELFSRLGKPHRWLVDPRSL